MSSSDAPSAVVTSPEAAVRDPWRAAPAQRRRIGGGLLEGVAVAVIGLGGVVLRLADDGPSQLRAAAALVALAIVAHAVARRLRTGRSAAALVGVVVAVPAAASLVVPAAGRAPMLFAVAGLLLAELALSGPHAGAHPPPATGPGATRLAVPVLALAQVTWWQRGSNAAMVVLTSIAALVVVVTWRQPRAAVVLAARLERGLGRVAEWVGLVVVLLVALPLVYLPGLVVRVVTNLRHGGRRSGWRERQWDEREIRRDAVRPFSSAPPAERRRRNVAGALVLCVVLAAGYLAARPTGAPSGGAAAGVVGDAEPGVADDAMAALAQIEQVPYSERLAYRGVDFADELQADLARVPLVPRSGVGYGLGDLQTGTVVVRDGVRRTVLTPCAGCATASIWLVGGSAAFGMGQRDAHTVASELSRQAARDGIALDVTNLGVPGWTLDQEVEAVRQRLASGVAPPDLVVHLSGYNDVVAAMIDATLTGDVEGSARLDPDQVGRFVEQVRSERRVLDGAALGEIAADRYRFGMSEARRVGAQAGVPVVMAFQPDALSSPQQRRAVTELYAALPGFHDVVALDAALDAASRSLAADGVIDLRSALDAEADPVFADTVHTNERGAEVLASRLWQELAPHMPTP